MVFRLYLADRKKKPKTGIFFQPTGVGFTGTSSKITDRQLAALANILEVLLGKCDGPIFHHGDCIEGDEKAHKIALKNGAKVIIYPPTNEYKRAFCKRATKIMPPKPYLERNKDIVINSDKLVAAPSSKKEELRSGTWSTVRFARKLKRPIYFIFPDGSVKLELEKDRVGRRS